MENTNLPSGYSPAPGANESSGSLKKVLVSLVVLLLVGGAAAYAYLNFIAPKSVAKLDASSPPPSLQVAGGAKGSFVETTQGTLQFDSGDKTAYEANASALKSKYTTAGVAKPGVNYLFADQEITLEDVVKGVDPVANKLLLAYYDQGSFWTYPKGPFTGTKEIKKDDLKTFKIPKNRVVIVITDKETTSYGLRSPTDKPVDTLTVAPMGDSESGWVLVASKLAKLADLIAPFGNRVVSAWALKGQNDFGDKPVDLSNFTFSTYSVAWLQLTTKPATSSGTTATTTTTNAPTITAVTPASLIQGQKAAKITIEGTNLANKTVTISPSASFANVSAATASSDGKKIEITLDVKDDAALGPIQIKVGDAINNSLAITQKGLTAPKITSVSPTSLVQGDQQKEIVLTGENLTNAQLESVQDLTIYSYEGPTATTFKFKVNVPDTAPVGLKEIKISKGADVVTVKTLEIKAKGSPVSEEPTISSISPSYVTQSDSNVEIKINGNNFTSEATVKFGENESKAVQLPNSIITVTKTLITVKITKIADDAVPGNRIFIVTTSKGTAKNNIFEVKAKAAVDTKPTITEVSPTSLVQNELTELTIKGTNLKNATVTASGSNLTFVSKDVLSNTSITVNALAEQTAAPGKRDITVTTSSGTATLKDALEIKQKVVSTDLQVGSPILANYSDKGGTMDYGVWAKGKITAIGGSGSSAKYDIVFDDNSPMKGYKATGIDGTHVANLAVHPDKIVKGYQYIVADLEPIAGVKGFYWGVNAESETEGVTIGAYKVKFDLQKTYIPLAGPVLVYGDPLAKGKRVLANWWAPNQYKWTFADITEVNGDKFKIEYDEGDELAEKPKSMIAPVSVHPQASDLKIGSQIVAESAYTPGTYWSATVQKVNSDGTADVTTDDNTEYKAITMYKLYIPGGDASKIVVDTTKLATDDANWTIQFVE